MKRAFLLVFLAACPVMYGQYGIGLAPVRPGAVAPDVPAVNPDPNFPLRVHLLTARYGGIRTASYHGYGSLLAPLADRTAMGFDWLDSSATPFVPNQSAKRKLTRRDGLTRSMALRY